MSKRDRFLQSLKRIVTWLSASIAGKLLSKGLRMFWGGLNWLGRGVVKGLRPLSWMAKIAGKSIRAIWRFVGRVGLAARHLLTVFGWDPFLLVTSPIRRLYRATMRPIILWLGGILRRRLSAAWSKTAPIRFRLRRRWLSDWALFKAKWRVRIRQLPAPGNAFHAEHIPLPKGVLPSHLRLIRTGSLLIAINVLLVGLALSQQGEADLALAEAVTPTPALLAATLTPPPTHTPTPLPTLDPAPWPIPDPLGNSGSMAFAMKQNGNQDIYAVSVGQQHPIRLTSHAAPDRDPAWSPDGSKVAFASTRSGNWDIFMLDLREGELAQLTIQTGYDANPAWSPDGEWLAFESYQGENFDIYLVNVSGGKPIRLTVHPAADFAPVWSPDGRHISFASWRAGNKDIFIRNLDAPSESATVNLTASPARQEDNPAFNDDGSMLAFDDSSEGFDFVYALPLERYLPASAPVLLGQGKQPNWSSDNQALVYVHENDAQSYLIAGSLKSWSVAPQAFAGSGDLASPDWTAANLPRNVTNRLTHVEQGDAAPLYRESVEKQREGAPYLLNQSSANAVSPFLSDRVDDSFNALRQQAMQEAGWDAMSVLDNLFEPLDASPLPGQSERSWNKAGRAFDLDARSVLTFDPQIEVVREDRGNEIFWRVYLRAARQDGGQGEPLRALPWDFRARYGQDASYYDQGGKYKDEIPAGYYVDFTALAADYGWKRTAAAESWRTFYPGIRFWHFEKRDGLSWEEAMLELYLPAELSTVFSP